MAKSVEKPVHYERCNLEKYRAENYVPSLFLALSEYCPGNIGLKRIVSLSSCKSNLQARVRAGTIRQLMTCFLFFTHQVIIVSQIYNKVKLYLYQAEYHSKHSNACTEVRFLS